MGMYRNSNIVIRISSTVLSSLLFIIVLESLSRECRSSLPWEIFYADDLVIIAEELGARYAASKNCMESKGLRVNLAKTKVISDIKPRPNIYLRQTPMWSLF